MGVPHPTNCVNLENDTRWRLCINRISCLSALRVLLGKHDRCYTIQYKHKRSKLAKQNRKGGQCHQTCGLNTGHKKKIKYPKLRLALKIFVLYVFNSCICNRMHVCYTSWWVAKWTMKMVSISSLRLERRLHDLFCLIGKEGLFPNVMS